MKFKVKFRRRTNVYITLLACVSGLWLLHSRFGLSWQQVKEFFLISLVLLLFVLAIALPASALLWFINSRRDKEIGESDVKDVADSE